MDSPVGITFTWEQFAAIIGGTLSDCRCSVERSTLLVADLGLDSLEMVELMVTLIDGCGMDSIADDLMERDWTRVTAGSLFDEYLTGGASQSATHR